MNLRELDCFHDFNERFYKMSVAKKYDELISSIREHAAFVIGKVADALNNAGKSVKGSRVAILGMAYKKKPR